MPFFRTYVPFIAGMAGMRFKEFFPWSVLGGLGWVVVCIMAGYFFGNIPFVKQHFELVVLTIICVSATPVVLEYLRGKSKKGKASIDAAL